MAHQFTLKDQHDRVLHEFLVEPGAVWVLGSSPKSDVVLDPSEDIHPDHCHIIGEADGVAIKNTSVIGKVYLNGLQITYRPLVIGDRVQLGPYELFFDEALAAESPDEVEPLVEEEPILTDDAILTTAAAGPTELEEDQGTIISDLTIAQLVWIGPDGDHGFELKGDAYVVGRGSLASIRVDDESLSREHFQVYQREGIFYLKDLGSTHGTRVNGVRVVETRLHDQDEIGAGDSLFRVVIGLRESLQAPPELPKEEKTQVVEFIAPKPKKKPKPKPKWLAQRRNQFIVLGGLGLILALVFLIEPEEEAAPKKPVVARKPAQVKPKDPWDLLTKVQQNEIKEMYAQAQSLMARKAWEQAYVLLRKIKDFGIPYKNIDALMRRSQNEIIALEKKLYEEEQKDAEKERAAAIEQYLREGRFHLEKGSFDRAREAFANVLELDPLNDEALQGLEAAQSKKEDIDFKERERRIKEQNEKRVQDYMAQLQQAIENNEFDEARALLKERLGVVPYTTPYWDGQFLELVGQIDQREQSFYEPLVQEAEAFLQSEEWSKAWKRCHEILQKNSKIIAAQKCQIRAAIPLRIRSKKLYKDSIVAESLGNVTEAKEKWQQIIEIAPTDDTYYKRAQEKILLY